MSSVQRSTGNAYDISGQARTLTLAGNPTYRIYNSGTYDVPYVDFDGTGDLLSRTDETDLDILGTETIFGVAQRGMSMGCWAQFDDETPAALEVVIGKRAAAGNLSYYLWHNTTGEMIASVSNDGTALVNASTTGTTGTGWVFVGMSYDPSTSLNVFLGVGGSLEKVANTTGVPASIFNSNADFAIGGRSGAAMLMAGNVTFAWLSANYLADNAFTRLYTRGRVLFGV